jgi:hypothetical protein
MSPAGKAHTPESVAASFRQEGIEFEPPANWRQVADDDGRAINFLSPKVDGGHDAHMLIELPYSVGDLSPEQELRLRSIQEGDYLVDYAVRRLVTQRSSRGIFYALLEYECTKFKRHIPVIEQRILVPIAGSRRMLVAGSSVRAAARRNLPIFERFMNSLVCPQ